MPPALLVDLSSIDLNRVIYNVADIEQMNPHRFEMRLLDGVVHLDLDKMEVVGFKDTREDEFWVRGHIPGRPLLPGVLMIEAAAQLTSFAVRKLLTQDTRFFGFSGINNVKFRLQITPGQRLYLLGKFTELRPRRFKFAAQGVTDQCQQVFEAEIIGMPI